MTLLSTFHAWFSRLVALREKHPFRFPALFAVVCFVALARAQLELLTAHKAPYDAASILNNVAFYLLSAYLYAALACLVTGKRLENVAGIVAFGVFLGVFPPLIDTLISGAGHGYYRYVADGFATWSFTLVSPAHYSTGEAITLWILVVSLGLYVLEVTRSLARAALALALSYAGATFMAIGPSSAALLVAEHASPFGRGSWLLLVSLLQLVCTQACYLAARPALAKRLLPRLLHALPFVALTLLGGNLARLFAPELNVSGSRALTAFACLLILQLCAVALVQNDAYDAKQDGRDREVVREEDAHFFTTVGLLVVLLMLGAAPTVGIPLGLFLCVSTVYSYDFYRAKRLFPANYKCEGIWGWSSFVVGGSALVTLRPQTVLPAPWLWSSFVVFGGFSIFNAFKDYKDIRADYKARVQTIYTLAVKRGVRLRPLHNRLRGALALMAVVPALGLGLSGRVAWPPLAAVTLAVLLAFAWSLGKPPRPSSVKAYLMSVACFVLLLAAVVDRPAGPPPTAPVAAVAPAKPSSELCAAHGPWRDAAGQLPFVAWRKLTVTDYAGSSSEGCYPVATPATVQHVQDVVRTAARLRAPIRIRGAGHSMNGSSLPAANELLLSTAALDELRFETPGTVVAQSGVRMHDVEHHVRPYGLHVPVVNDGPPAPTVGGYVAAGGLGVGSMEHGGFWENVASLTVVDGTGALRRVERTDDDFLWFFGAMGQLGVVVEAELDVVPAKERALVAAADPYGERKRIRVPSTPLPQPSRSAPLVWFTLLVRPDQLATARAELSNLQARFSARLRMLQPYTYPFIDRGRIPPLFFGQVGGLTAVGIWAQANDARAAHEIDRAFAALVERHGFRRYIQTELTRGPDAYRTYFGAATYGELRQRKRHLDPFDLFNRGTFFESAVAPSLL